MTWIPDRCGGTGRIIWSDDSYASYNIKCSGCPDCKKEVPVISKREEEESRINAARDRQQPQRPAAIKVSVPVRIGAYTGLDGAWSELERDYTVSIAGENIVLIDYSNKLQPKIEIPREVLEDALKVVEDYS